MLREKNFLVQIKDYPLTRTTLLHKYPFLCLNNYLSLFISQFKGPNNQQEAKDPSMPDLVSFLLPPTGVFMSEILEIIYQWHQGAGFKAIRRSLGFDRNTVRSLRR